MFKGLIQVYTGNSKGKTTAALGLSLRAIGHGYKVYFLQFMKGSNYYGEISTLNKLSPQIEHAQFGRPCRNGGLIKEGLSTCIACGKCFIKKGDDISQDKEEMKKALDFSLDIITSEDYNIVVLDEILNCIYFDIITEDELLNLLSKKPSTVELVLTGRNATENIISKADLVTNMGQVKHPFEQGVMARRGIEY
ncbi:cob(I)yrinic acid a,c-diamide adenosyltransferase [Proteinivorax tanatarense]|uniref:Cob(I)yrinic acid a,c-diamide adenosyltransferase n=1 Tax=Proteinivorax tanatarense TaxID=1260629 RepID=A0AAU7VI27_9FIRM